MKECLINIESKNNDVIFKELISEKVRNLPFTVNLNFVLLLHNVILLRKTQFNNLHFLILSFFTFCHIIKILCNLAIYVFSHIFSRKMSKISGVQR